MVITIIAILIAVLIIIIVTNVVVNKYGVFIFEVKNYKGQLYGNEDDYNWKKYKDDGYGNTFVKEVKNPIKIVNRKHNLKIRADTKVMKNFRGCSYFLSDNPRR